MVRERVLLIDTDPAAREAAVGLLEEAGYEVRSAWTFQQFHEALVEWRPRAVVIEPVLDGIDGFELSRAILTSYPGARPEIILASNKLRGRIATDKARNVGARAFLEGPVEDRRLVDAIAAVLEEAGEPPALPGPGEPAWHAPPFEARCRDAAPAAEPSFLERVGFEPVADETLSLPDEIEFAPAPADAPAPAPEPSGTAGVLHAAGLAVPRGTAEPVTVPRAGGRRSRGRRVLALAAVAVAAGLVLAVALRRDPVTPGPSDLPSGARHDAGAAAPERAKAVPRVDAIEGWIPSEPLRAAVSTTLAERRRVPAGAESEAPSDARPTAVPVRTAPAAAAPPRRAPAPGPARAAAQDPAPPVAVVEKTPPPPVAVPPAAAEVLVAPQDPVPDAAAEASTGAPPDLQAESDPVFEAFAEDPPDAAPDAGERVPEAPARADPPPPAPETSDPVSVAPPKLTEPIPLTRVEPEYPAPARRHGVRGTVTLRATVLPDGSVGRVEIVSESAPRWRFGEAAVEAVRRWRYEPARRGGEPVEATVSVQLVFENE